jgi:hypothetical protein
MTNLTDVYFNKDDIGKNLYRKKTYYTLCIEQDVLAKNQDEADDKLSDNGIDHAKISKDLTETNDGVETYMVDANYTESDTTKFLGKVKYDDDTISQSLEDAVENEDVHIDTYADEDEPLQQTEAEKDCAIIQKSIDDLNEVEAKADADVDVSLNLANESKLGK